MYPQIIDKTLAVMSQKMQQRNTNENISQLIFMGNVHDSYPRRLLLDKQLSPTDKMTWMMIRLFSLQNQGAAFPSYDELQELLSSSHSEKASRDTVSRSLLMLRMTGWLSLLKKVRDEKGIYRGNIYALHDEPLLPADAEFLDTTYFDLLETCLKHNKKSLRLTAQKILSDIKIEPKLKHRQKRIALIESRLDFMEDQNKLKSKVTTETKATKTPSSNFDTTKNTPGSNSELGKNQVNLDSNIPSSNFEPGTNEHKNSTSKFELGLESLDSIEVRNSNSYVRNNVNINKYVYVGIPEKILELIKPSDREQIISQMKKLDSSSQKCIIENIEINMKSIKNLTGYFYSMLQKARNGTLNKNTNTTSQCQTPDSTETPNASNDLSVLEEMELNRHKKASPEKISETMQALIKMVAKK